MARLTRQLLKLFGGSGGTSNFGQFGSQAASAPVETKDVSVIQALGAWDNGWQDAVALGQAPYLQDMNAEMYVQGYELCYVLQEGVPEWNTGTTYNKGSVVKLPYNSANNFQIFVSLVDSNVGNALPTGPASDGNWQFVYGFVSSVFTMGTGIAFGNNATQGIIGTPTNNDAATGFVGEYVASIASLTNFAATTTYGDLTSISLTAGDWDVTLFIVVAANGSTVVNTNTGVSIHPGDDQTGLNEGNSGQFLPAGVTANSMASIPNIRFSLSSTTTLYLKYRGTFSGGTPQAKGRLSARRVR